MAFKNATSGSILGAAAGCDEGSYDPGFKLGVSSATKVRGLIQLLQLLPYDADLCDENGTNTIRVIPQSDGSVLLAATEVCRVSDTTNYEAVCSTSDYETTKASADTNQCTAAPTKGSSVDNYTRQNLWQQAFMVRIQQDNDVRQAVKDANLAIDAFDTQFAG